MSISSSLQDMQSGQGTDVQLPADIEPHDSLQGDRAAGAGQTEAPPALLVCIVGVLSRIFNRHSATAHHQQCVCRREYKAIAGYRVSNRSAGLISTLLVAVVGFDLSAAFDTINHDVLIESSLGYRQRASAGFKAEPRPTICFTLLSAPGRICHLLTC